ncbi:putative DsbA family dithiol-disulfide isomerase [Brevibacillus aydinogluensis]|uniref:DsbA family oxidoreductase n=1 Tax=Brevibacillus aydinogluensis TaxID=927786 RepID=UPI002892CA8A|nr:DsbA family oxidoreductase [Brevibacillus aydinogluensis]MDT3415494.1 putative DsbA family dithiol-disulfide isomerase [Brevibacillus aydinogluensis]
MIIEIFQDTICPWCRIGKKHLFDAIRQWGGEPVTIRYRAYQLNPDTPKEGLPFWDTMAAMKGGRDVVERMVQPAANAGEAAGVPFRFDRVKMWPNTYASHTLIKLAPPEKATDLVDAIFQAYFEEGKDIGSLDVLAAIAVSQGMDADWVRSQLVSDAKREEIAEDLAYARELNITGVPFFIIDGKLALSGAHPADNFLQAFRQATDMSTHQ